PRRGPMKQTIPWLACAFCFLHVSQELRSAGDRGPGPNVLKKVEKNATMLSASVPARTRVGSALTLQLQVKNLSTDTPVYYREWYGGAYWNYDLELQDSNGQSVPFTRFGGTAYSNARGEGSGVIAKLPPGKSFEA